MLVRPQRHARKAIHEAVAVRPHERNTIGRGQQFVLQPRVAGFGKAAGVDDGALQPLGPQRAQHLNGGLALHRDERGIHGPFHVAGGLHRVDATQLLALRVHRPDLAREP